MGLNRVRDVSEVAQRATWQKLKTNAIGRQAGFRAACLHPTCKRVRAPEVFRNRGSDGRPVA